MIIVRPVKQKDLDALMDLARAAYPGMTTLPPDESKLAKKIEHSLQSVACKTEEAGNQTYLLVMEDTSTNTLVGTAGIIAKLGEDDQFYSYKLNKITQHNRQTNKKISVETLHLTNHFEGFSEVATLYLADKYRKNGNGKLLARSRYLFMAEFRERFPKQVMADLRGYFDENGRSPFWEALGRHFFDMDYTEADLHGALNGNQFIADLMPKHPIYVNLLTEEARAVIGRPNDQGKAALAMLEKEGFRWNGQIDIFDGAPSVDTYIDDLASVQNSQTAKLSGELNNATEQSYIICTGDVQNFRVCISPLSANDANNASEVSLPQETIDALALNPGQKIRYVAL
ncbi:arginine N-succinyltransferase [Agaribacter flavus]|uniref:Arginine N-succinyltransferase n=1 Tax=Agaribacter flavus TaxID=1902781 RepID=A0ABV7FQX0_9ALTE